MKATLIHSEKVTKTIHEPAFDADGSPIFELDDEGKPKIDEKGQKVQKTVGRAATFARISFDAELPSVTEVRSRHEFDGGSWRKVDFKHETFDESLLDPSHVGKTVDFASLVHPPEQKPEEKHEPEPEQKPE